MMPEEEQIKHYDKIGNTSAAWILSADSLQAAARILRTHRDRFDPMQLKVGDNVPDEGKILFPETHAHGIRCGVLAEGLMAETWEQVNCARKVCGR